MSTGSLVVRPGQGMTFMHDRYFLDTNLLIYAHDTRNPKKMEITQRLPIDGIKMYESISCYYS